MSTVTIRLDEEKKDRLRRMAARRGISLGQLLNEIATEVLAQQDAETRFRDRAAQGSADRGLTLLDKLDAAFEKT